MATSEEVNAVCYVLNKEWPEDSITQDVAEACIKVIDAIRATTWRPVGPPLKLHQPFKSIITQKTHYPMWVGTEREGGPELAWIVTADSDYGWFAPSDSPFWRWTVAARVQEKTVEKVMTNDAGMEPGDRITLRQDGQYEVMAVFCKGVLLKHRATGNMWPETNGNLAKYYTDGWK